jgi:thiamine biosynthesis protein ThiS
MNVYVNGQPTELEAGMTLSGLIARLELGGQRVAVEVNEELVPRGRFEDHRLAPDDRVEIIHAVGGG